MNKRVIRLVVYILAIAIVFSLAGCASGGETTTSSASQKDSSVSLTESQSTSAGAYKVGINYFVGAAYSLLSLLRTSEQATIAAGGEVMALDDQASIEQIIADCENMIQNGCEGIILWCPVETLIPTIADMCKDAKIPFVLSDKVPTNQSIIDELYDNPYFVGGVVPANSEYGAYAAEVALENGLKNAIVSAPMQGDGTGQPRTEGFQEVFEAGGGTVHVVVNNPSNVDSQMAVENALTAYPEAEVIFGTGSDYGKSSILAVEAKGVDVKVITCDFDETLLPLVGQGTLLGVVGDYWISGFYAGILLQNWLDGTPLLDNGKAPWYEDVMYFSVTGDQIDLYKKFWIDEFCYSPEEIRQMFVKNNPGFTWENLVQIMISYNLEERLNAKLDEGKVSANELQAAGVNVN